MLVNLNAIGKLHAELLELGSAIRQLQCADEIALPLNVS
jgi:hypothetical protein